MATQGCRARLCAAPASPVGRVRRRGWGARSGAFEAVVRAEEDAEDGGKGNIFE